MYVLIRLRFSTLKQVINKEKAKKNFETSITDCPYFDLFVVLLGRVRIICFKQIELHKLSEENLREGKSDDHLKDQHREESIDLSPHLDHSITGSLSQFEEQSECDYE